ncbi:hypothetical protein PGQ11_013142 [Apiospora arundinis]|uniref:Uncharacterized protein n=1 Tax=Apiospora arundinis TaxID=335852 RepID=A0ABR2I5L5_9PEZI
MSTATVDSTTTLVAASIITASASPIVTTPIVVSPTTETVTASSTSPAATIAAVTSTERQAYSCLQPLLNGDFGQPLMNDASDRL